MVTDPPARETADESDLTEARMPAGEWETSIYTLGGGMGFMRLKRSRLQPVRLAARISGYTPG